MRPGALLADPLRVTHISDDLLEIENRPLGRATVAVLVILVSIAAGLAAIADGAVGTGIVVLSVVALIGWLYLHELVQLTQLSLDRRAGLVRLRVTTLRGRREETFALPDLQSLACVVQYGSASGTDEARLMLIFGSDVDRREVILPMFRPDPEELSHLTGVLNDWLSRDVQRDSP